MQATGGRASHADPMLLLLFQSEREKKWGKNEGGARNQQEVVVVEKRRTRQFRALTHTGLWDARGRREEGGLVGLLLYYYRGAEKSVSAARVKTVRENLVTLIVSKMPKFKKLT